MEIQPGQSTGLLKLELLCKVSGYQCSTIMRRDSRSALNQGWSEVRNAV